MIRKGTYLDRFEKQKQDENGDCIICRDGGDICQEAIAALAEDCHTTPEQIAHLIYVGVLSSQPSTDEIDILLGKLDGRENGA